MENSKDKNNTGGDKASSAPVRAPKAKSPITGVVHGGPPEQSPAATEDSTSANPVPSRNVDKGGNASVPKPVHGEGGGRSRPCTISFAGQTAYTDPKDKASSKPVPEIKRSTGGSSSNEEK